MAVYTDITAEELTSFIERYDLGTLKSFEGIEKGVSNSNYHVFTDKGRYILTLFEEHRTRREDLPFYFAYADHLNSRGLRCPSVIADRKGDTLQTLHAKPAALIEFLEGCDIPRGQTHAEHCRQMGEFLGRMHLAVQDFDQSRKSEWCPSSFHERFNAMKTHIAGKFPAAVFLILKDLLDIEVLSDDLPGGVCHLDLFPDNIFFLDKNLSAMIDVYFAADAPFIYDLAITINAWCFDAQRRFDAQNFQAMLEGYETQRALSDQEKAVFQKALRLAAIRFLLSRLEEWFSYDPEKVKMKPHDPAEYIEILFFHHERNVMDGL